MRVLNWCFIALNVVICVACLWSRQQNRNGLGNREQLTSPSNWIWVWQLVGVVLVVSLKFNPWHLIWWFIVGNWVRRIMPRVQRDASLAWRMPRLYQNWSINKDIVPQSRWMISSRVTSCPGARRAP